MASIYQHKKEWRAIVTVKGRRVSGIFRTRREAQHWASITETELRENLNRPPAESHTVTMMLEQYADTITSLKAQF